MPFKSENVIETYRGDGKNGSTDVNGDYTWERADTLTIKDCPRGNKWVRLAIGSGDTVIDVLADDLIAAVRNATNVNNL